MISGEELLAFYEAILAFARARLPRSHRDQAEDVTQEVLLAVFEKVRDEAEVKDLAAYVYRIARNKVADVYRKKKRDREDAVDGAEMDRYLTALREKAAEVRLQERERLAALGKALNSLPPLKRQMLWMREIMGLSNVEASDRLGVSPAEGSRLLYRARQHLLQILDEW